MKAASTIPTNEQLCTIARAYILEEHARVGDRIYYWDNWNISVDAKADGDSARDNDAYSWATTLSCDITEIQVSERNDSAQEYIVTVAADITIGCGINCDGAETENKEDVEHEKHVFYCYIRSGQEDYFVISVEE
jgi:hypothetical protein